MRFNMNFRSRGIKQTLLVTLALGILILGIKFSPYLNNFHQCSPNSQANSLDSQKTTTQVNQKMDYLLHSILKERWKSRKEIFCDIPIVAVVLAKPNIVEGIKHFQSNSSTKDIPFIVIGSKSNNKNIAFPNITKDFLTFLTKRLHGEMLYLSVDMQDNLFPELWRVLSNNVEHRRSLGYLAALALGACRIWDYESDTSPLDSVFFQDDSLKRIQEISALTIYSHHSSVANPLLLFGPTILNGKSSPKKCVYPSGMPLSDIKRNEIPTLYATDLLRKSSSIEHHFRVGILKTVVNYDQTVLSMQKFAKVNYKSRLNTVNMHPTQFSPFSSQSSLYFYETFWSAYFPLTVPQHLSHVWQSYITQTLMRCTGFLLTFHKPVTDKTSSSSQGKVKDIDENSNNSKIISLLKTLSKFSCSSDKLSDCMEQLYSQLYHTKSIGKADVIGIKAWVHTLKLMGYRFPSMKPKLCDKLSKPFFNIQAPQHPKSAVAKFTSQAQSLAVVHINFQHVYVIPLWLSINQYISPKVLFYAPGSKGDTCSSMATESLYCISDDEAGYYSYESILHAMEHFPQYEVYVASHDDSFYNPRMLQEALDKKRSYLPHPGEFKYFIENGTVRIDPKAGGGYWKYDNIISTALSDLHKSGALKPLIPKLSKYCPGQPKTFKRGAAFDTYIIHKDDKPVLLPIMKTFRNHNLFLETAVPWALHCAVGAATTAETTIDFMDSHFHYVYGEQDVRKTAWKSKYCVGVRKSFKNSSSTVGITQVIHPIKLLGDRPHILAALTVRECLLDSSKDQS